MESPADNLSVRANNGLEESRPPNSASPEELPRANTSSRRQVPPQNYRYQAYAESDSEDNESQQYIPPPVTPNRTENENEATKDKEEQEWEWEKERHRKVENDGWGQDYDDEIEPKDSASAVKPRPRITLKARHRNSPPPPFPGMETRHHRPPPVPNSYYGVPRPGSRRADGSEYEGYDSESYDSEGYDSERQDSERQDSGREGQNGREYRSRYPPYASQYGPGAIYNAPYPGYQLPPRNPSMPYGSYGQSSRYYQNPFAPAPLYGNGYNLNDGRNFNSFPDYQARTGYFGGNAQNYYYNPALAGYETLPYQGSRNPFAPYYGFPYYGPNPPPNELPPTPAPPPAPPDSPLSSALGPTFGNSGDAEGDAAAKPPLPVPEPPDWGKFGIPGPQRLLFNPSNAQRASRIVHAIKITGVASGLEKQPVLGTADKAALAWLQPYSTLEDDKATSELLEVQSLEHFEDGSGRNNVTLVSVPKTVTKANKDSSSIQMRWLHIKRQTLSLGFLARLISHCPPEIMSYDLKQVAISLLKDGCPDLQRRLDTGQSFEAGAMLRFTGIYPEDAMKETDPVTFVSIPYFMLREKRKRLLGQDDFNAPTLLQSLYGYDVGDEREGNQVVNKMNRFFAKKRIHVPQVWCLMIGPGILVTLADCSFAELHHGGITVDHGRYSAHGDSCLIRVIDIDNEEFKFVVPRSCSLLKLWTHLAILVRRKYPIDQFELLSENKQPLNSEAWILFMSEAAEDVTLLIRSKGWKEANESKRAKGEVQASRSAPSAQQLIAYGGPYNNIYSSPYQEMVPYQSNSLPLSPYTSGNVPGQLLYNRTSTNPFAPIASQDPYGPSPAMWSNPFSPRTPLWPHGPWFQPHHPPPPPPQPPELYFRKEDTERKNEETRAMRTSSSKRHKGMQLTVSKVMFRAETPTEETCSEMQEGSSQPSKSQSPEVSEASESVNVARTPFLHHATKGNIERQKLNYVLLNCGHAPPIDSYYPPRENDRIKRLRKEGRVLNDISLAETPQLYDLQPEVSDDGKVEINKHGDVTSSLSGDSTDFEVTACSSLGGENIVKTASNHVEDEVVGENIQLKAVWVSGPPPPESDNARKPEDQKRGKQVRVEEPGRSEAPAGNTRAKSKMSFNHANISRSPFFTWKISQLGEDKDDPSKVAVITRLLNSANVSLVTREVLGKLYEKAYMCSVVELQQKHHNWINAQSTSLESTDYPPTEGEDPCMSGGLSTDVEYHANASYTQNGNGDGNSADHVSVEGTIDMGTHQETIFIFSRYGDEDSTMPSPQDGFTSPYCGINTRETAFNVQFERTGQSECQTEKDGQPRPEEVVRIDPMLLMALSKEVFDLFIPAELQIIHPLAEKYWGSLDRIFRQLKFAMENCDFEQPQRWSIRKDHVAGHSVHNARLSKPPRTAISDCEACNDSKTYSSSLEALSHFHLHHADCPGQSRYKHAFDDPCYVWLQAKYHRKGGKRYKSIAKLLHEFIKDLREICDRATDLQLAVASVDGASNQSTSAQSSVPSLTGELVQAFEDIVMAHIIKGKHFSLVNEWMLEDPGQNTQQGGTRMAPSNARNPSMGFLKKVEDVIQSGTECLARARQSIEQKRFNIMLFGTRTATGANISLDYIDVEFLVAVLIGHIQHQGISTESRPGALLDMYQKYTAKLQFEANRKPRRQVFFDIQALQEELGALRNVLDSQRKLLGSYGELTAPNLSKTPTTTRKNLYPLEIQHTNQLLHHLNQRDIELLTILDRSQGLREQVKQSIEILEEGHGKAIRVFTIVTLFFLPLSFVSSFFGMNVADIRDMEGQQSLFWSIAFPVTLGVLGIAYLYGYKWDALVDWLENLLEDFQERRKRQSSKPKMPVAETSATHLSNFTPSVGQNEGKQAEPPSEKGHPWLWEQITLNEIQSRYRKPKRINTNKSIGE